MEAEVVPIAIIPNSKDTPKRLCASHFLNSQLCSITDPAPQRQYTLASRYNKRPIELKAITTVWHFGLLYPGTSRPEKESPSEQTNEPHQQ